jgi:hypothetical protein
VENENMKKRIIVFAIGLTALLGLAVRALPALTGLGTPTQSVDREADRRDIIRAYESARAAHFQHNAAAFLANNDATWYLVAEGTVALRRTAAEKQEVQQYFDTVKFADITDLDPPHVEVSSDGTMAWLLGHVRVRGTQREAKGAEVPLSFDASWIDVWQKKPTDGELLPELTPRRTMLHTAERSALMTLMGMIQPALVPCFERILSTTDRGSSRSDRQMSASGMLSSGRCMRKTITPLGQLRLKRLARSRRMGRDVR